MLNAAADDAAAAISFQTPPRCRRFSFIFTFSPSRRAALPPPLYATPVTFCFSTPPPSAAMLPPFHAFAAAFRWRRRFDFRFFRVSPLVCLIFFAV
jgi:hypothetical protein